jgi:hypothetical protein
MVLFQNRQTVTQRVKPHHTRSNSLRNSLCCANSLIVYGALKRITVFWGVTLRRREPRDRRRSLASQTTRIRSYVAVKNPKTRANVIMIFGSFGHLYRS